MLKNSPKIPDINKKDIFQLNSCQSDRKYDKSAAVQISAVLGAL